MYGEKTATGRGLFEATVAYIDAGGFDAMPVEDMVEWDVLPWEKQCEWQARADELNEARKEMP